MMEKQRHYEDYFLHLQKISVVGRIYKRFFSSPILFSCARRFGHDIVEIGSGTGSGVLGTFPKSVRGLEINPLAVEYCTRRGLNVQLIKESGEFGGKSAEFDACILDNVLEHIEHPRQTLDECYRVTRAGGGLVIAVPGSLGFKTDPDHKRYYDAAALRRLDERWSLIRLFSMPFFLLNDTLSNAVRQYCLVATYRKN